MKLDETECRIIVAALGEYRQILALTEDPDRPVTDLHLRHVDDVEHLYDRFIGSLPENQNEGRVVKIARAASDVAQRSLALARLTRVANPQQSSGKQLFLACLLTVVLLFLLVPTDPMPKYPAALADLDVKALLDQLIGFLARGVLPGPVAFSSRIKTATVGIVCHAIFAAAAAISTPWCQPGVSRSCVLNPTNYSSRLDTSVTT